MNTEYASTQVFAPRAESASNGARLLERALSTSDGYGLAIARIALAVALFPHGAQKLLGWFGGAGFEGTMGFFTQGMGIPWILALGAILVEFFAPLLLVAGLAARPAALGIGIVMTVASLTHAQNGFFMNWMGTQQGEGLEFFVLAVGLAAAIAVSGAGALSADRRLAARLARR